MKSFFRLELFFVLAVSANLSPLKGAVVNDGTSTNTLIKIFNGNENDDGAVTSLLVDTNGFLIAEQAATTTFPARRNIWYPLGGFATSGVYTVSADFQPAQYSNERQGPGTRRRPFWFRSWILRRPTPMQLKTPPICSI
jgi:hypothetical protein